MDYIFYDDEPRFPAIEGEVSRAYFSNHDDLDNQGVYIYKKLIEEYKQYFYRMEMADSKFVGHYSDKLWNKLDVKDSQEKIIELGIEFAIKQCKELLDNGAPGIHFYTLNKAYSVSKILKEIR